MDIFERANDRIRRALLEIFAQRLKRDDAAKPRAPEGRAGPGIDYAPGPRRSPVPEFPMAAGSGDPSAPEVARTGRDLDVSIVGPGFIAIRAPDGGVACSRAGNLALNTGGLLTDGGGRPVLGPCGPIRLWRDARIRVLEDGTVSLRQPGEAPFAVDQILLLNPAPQDLVESEDGLLCLRKGVAATPDPEVRLLTGTLELDQTDPHGALARMIHLQRQFLMHLS